MEQKDVISIIRKTLNLVDSRLVDHGERVAYIILKMLQNDNTLSKSQLQKICLLAMLHDVGAYKTEEIDRLVEFETKNVWEHSVYGYLFLECMSPLADIADGILYHHLDYQKLGTVACKNPKIASIISLVDRLDVYFEGKGLRLDDEMPKLFPADKFCPEQLELFFHTNESVNLLEHLSDGSYLNELLVYLADYPFTQEEIDRYLKMLVSIIDFRSEVTVSHTIMTVNLSQEIARLMHLDKEERKALYYGALLHDLGKISTPVAILENPGKLTDSEMTVMRDHVSVTEEILGDYINTKIKNIAVRHHEKLDGSGYPHRLTGSELTPSERAIAVADIVSALTGKRSYKAGFGKEQTILILTEMAKKNKISAEITALTVENYDEILANAEHSSAHTLALYERIHEEYHLLLAKCAVL